MKYLKGTLVKTRRIRTLKVKYKITDKASLDNAKEKAKQMMQLKAQRLRRFDKRTKLFKWTPRSFTEK